MKLLLPKGAIAPLKFDASKWALFAKIREPIPGCGRQNPIAVERLIPLWTQDLFQASPGFGPVHLAELATTCGIHLVSLQFCNRNRHSRGLRTFHRYVPGNNR